MPCAERLEVDEDEDLGVTGMGERPELVANLDTC
jgi:hypothetical protein